MKKEFEELENNITHAINWFKSNGDKLLYTQKTAILFLINNIINKKKSEISIEKFLRKYLIDAIKDGKIEGAGGNLEDEEINDIIKQTLKDEEINSGIYSLFQKKFNAVFAEKITINIWKSHQPSTFTSNNILGGLSIFINKIAQSVIDIENFDHLPDGLLNKLSILLDRINERGSMTFDEEVNRLFEEQSTLLIEKFDVDPIGINEGGVTIKNIEYQEKWELFLWWVISKDNFCRCILHGSTNNFSIIGFEDNVNKVVELYEQKRSEIINNSGDRANKKILTDLTILASKGIHEQKDVAEIKARKDGYIKDYQYRTVDDLLSNVFVTISDKMNNVDAGTNAFIKEKFPNLGHKVVSFQR